MLQKLKSLRSKAQEKIKHPRIVFTTENLRDLFQLADNSPFFDATDRLNLHRMQETLAQETPDFAIFLETLDAFLLEHEILNDRERDRDFFVAMRRLGWVLAKEKELPPVVESIKKFVQQRRKRWQKRIDLLTDPPPSWREIKNTRPFLKDLNKIAHEKTLSARHLLVTTLTDKYRKWLQELEKHETKMRQKIHNKLKNKISKAQDKLRSMQKRQDEISKYLEKADTREAGDLLQKWPSMRRRQNTNIKQAKRLERDIAQISALAAERIKAAAEAMQAVNKNAKRANFRLAETHADLASRLLRQTRNATSSKLDTPRQRRRRNVTGDDYFGRRVIGGKVNLQRDYKVNRKYREDILEDIQNSNLLENHPILLDSYLRKIVR